MVNKLTNEEIASFNTTLNGNIKTKKDCPVNFRRNIDADGVIKKGCDEKFEAFGLAIRGVDETVEAKTQKQLRANREKRTKTAESR